MSAYLDFAELQALGKKAMSMKDWIAKLDAYLQLSEREILTHAGRVSHESAMNKAQLEYEKFRSKQDQLSLFVDQDFERAIKKISSKASKKNKE